MFDQLKKHWKVRRKIRFDRNNLEERARRFLKGYLAADDTQKRRYYQAVEDISKRCQSIRLIGRPDLNDRAVAEEACEAAIRMVQDHDYRKKKDERTADFVTDASATVAIAYRRAAGVYVADEKMQELGTAAVHLLTMATSYMSARQQ